MSFENFIKIPLQEGLKNDFDGIPTFSAKYNAYAGYIEKGKIISIGGRPNSGKVSFLDQTFLFSIFDWWFKQKEGYRPTLKIFYVGTKASLKNKFQKWLCLRMKLSSQILIDINTLNNKPGKLFDLDQTTIDAILSHKEYFEELKDAVQYITGHVKPSDLFNTVANYLDSIGHVDKGIYHEDSDHRGQHTYLFIDNVKRLTPESDGHTLVTDRPLLKRIKDYLVDLKMIYNVTTVVVYPTDTLQTRTPKDTEPNYKDLSMFADSEIDLALVMYNPWVERNTKYAGYDIQEFVYNGKDRFRSVSVVRNGNGACNITIPLLFLGECGYFNELPNPLQIEELEVVTNVLAKISKPYKKEE